MLGKIASKTPSKTTRCRIHPGGGGYCDGGCRHGNGRHDSGLYPRRRAGPSGPVFLWLRSPWRSSNWNKPARRYGVADYFGATYGKNEITNFGTFANWHKSLDTSTSSTYEQWTGYTNTILNLPVSGYQLHLCNQFSHHNICHQLRRLEHKGTARDGSR